MAGFEIFERFIVCLTPIIVALVGLQSSRVEKHTKDLVEKQKELNEAKKKIEANEKQALDDHFKKLDDSLSKLTAKVDKLDDRVGQMSKLDGQLKGLIEMSTANMELCQSLSGIVTSIADALDSTEIIDSGNLKAELQAHRKKENEITNRVMKIMY